MTDAATDQGTGNIVEDDCPLCLEPLPPFWDMTGRMILHCCGQFVCKGCKDKKTAHLDRAYDEGSFGRQEDQLDNTCPLCRAQKARDYIDNTRMMQEKFDKGQLPLILYSDLWLAYTTGPGGVEINVERGNKILMAGAEMGDPNCQFSAGCGYDKGLDGLRKSPNEAKQWYLAATEQGHAIAEYRLAVMANDEGNDAEYLRYLRGSALKGCNEACCSLGLHYYYGEHGGSAEEVIQLVTPAAERGHAPSMGVLGTAMCRPDPHLPPPMPRDNLNFTQGMQLMRRAVEKGSRSSNLPLKAIEKWASSTCFRCSKKVPPEEALLRCSRCRAAWYCSKDCQVQHWKAEEGGHKQCCIKWCPSFRQTLEALAALRAGRS